MKNLAYKLFNHIFKNTKTFNRFESEISLIGSYFESHPPKIKVRNGAYFFLPQFWRDHIQREIYKTKNFFEVNELVKIDTYVPDEPTILDIGANIGNHTIYWCLERRAKLIHAFEPIEGTFALLSRNVEANELGDRVVLHNLGLSDTAGRAAVKHFNERNIGATQLDVAPSGSIELNSLDELDLQIEKVDLIKIDVEGLEVRVLLGARNFIQKHRPLLSIEAVGANLQKVDELLKDLNYNRIEMVGWCTYIYSPA